MLQSAQKSGVAKHELQISGSQEVHYAEKRAIRYFFRTSALLAEERAVVLLEAEDYWSEFIEFALEIQWHNLEESKAAVQDHSVRETETKLPQKQDPGVQKKQKTVHKEKEVKPFLGRLDRKGDGCGVERLEKAGDRVGLRRADPLAKRVQEHQGLKERGAKRAFPRSRILKLTSFQNGVSAGVLIRLVRVLGG